jgi:hypothetical protein
MSNAVEHTPPDTNHTGDTGDTGAPSSPAAGDQPTRVWGTLDGVEITFPMVVNSMDVATGMFTADAAVAQSLIPGDDFVVLEVEPGRAQFVLAACDYIDNPWGDYLELNLGFLVAERQRPDQMGSFVYRMPVDQEFTCRAGNEVMGFPKTVEQLSCQRTTDAVTFGWEREGEMVMSLRVARVAAAGEPMAVETSSYSYLNGVPYATPLEMQMASGVVDPAAVELRLGRGQAADELRSLALSDPTFATWGEGLAATFGLGSPIASA